MNNLIDIFTEAQLSVPPNNTSFNNTFPLDSSVHLQTHQNNELTTNIYQDNKRILYKGKVFITWQQTFNTIEEWAKCQEFNIIYNRI